MRLVCLLEGFLDTLRMGLHTGEWTLVSGHVFVYVPAYTYWYCERCGMVA